MRRYLETGEARIVGIGREVECLRKDGSIFPADLSISELDHLGLYVGVVTDVSERRQLQNDMLRSVSEEQIRIGQDLHDTAGQDLTGLKYLIRNHLEFLRESVGVDLTADPGRLHLASELATIQKASEAIEALQKKIRTVIRGLAPVDVSGEGLKAALLDLTAGVRELHHLHCEFQSDNQVLIEDNVVATHLYRIAQEAISNAIRHGAASRISVALESGNGSIGLTISDNGSGIDGRTQTTNGGFGLRIMNYRARLIGALFSIESKANCGYTIRCVLPQVKKG